MARIEMIFIFSVRARLLFDEGLGNVFNFEEEFHSSYITPTLFCNSGFHTIIRLDSNKHYCWVRYRLPVYSGHFLSALIMAGIAATKSEADEELMKLREARGVQGQHSLESPLVSSLHESLNMCVCRISSAY